MHLFQNWIEYYRWKIIVKHKIIRLAIENLPFDHKETLTNFKIQTYQLPRTLCRSSLPKRGVFLKC